MTNYRWLITTVEDYFSVNRLFVQWCLVTYYTIRI